MVSSWTPSWICYAPPSELSRCVPHLSPTPLRCKGSLSLPVGSHCRAGIDQVPYCSTTVLEVKALACIHVQLLSQHTVRCVCFCVCPEWSSRSTFYSVHVELPQWWCMYSRVRASSSVCTLHTAITEVIIALELWGVSRANYNWNSPQFQYFNHMSERNYIETRKIPYTVCTYVRGAHL